MNTYLVRSLDYILYSYNNVSQRKENVMKKIIRQRKYIWEYLLKRNPCVSGPTKAKPCCPKVNGVVESYLPM